MAVSISFEEAVHNQDYQRVIKSVTSKFHLSPEDRQSCGLIGLWKAVEKHKPECGNKFTTSLFRHVRWQCLQRLREGQPYFTSSSQQQSVLPQLPTSESLEALPADLREVVQLYVFGKYSFREIGRLRGFSKATARNHFLKAIELLKEVLLND